LPGFQVQSLANHEEQQGIMTTFETIGVIGGGDDAGRLHGVIRGGARAANSAPSVRAAAAATFESGA
jgi:hypothetical protein